MNAQRIADFPLWMVQVDELIARAFLGMDSNDLPDQPYRDWYEDGLSPREALTELVENVATDDGLDVDAMLDFVESQVL